MTNFMNGNVAQLMEGILVSSSERDTVFISYATNDSGQLATWLAIKLTLAGYKVWLDKIKLKGGRPFISDIESVIKNNACRVLALMSPGAISRPNPKRERSIASQVRDQLQIADFIIPVRAHKDFKPNDLDFYTTDHQWVDFSGSWATGLVDLLDTLSLANIPKAAVSHPSIISQLLDVDAKAEEREERLWSNLTPILELPEKLFVYSLSGKSPRSGNISWASWHLKQSSEYIAFRPPPGELCDDYTEIAEVSWREQQTYKGIPTINIIKSLIKKELEYDCVRRGMRYTIDGKKIFFPRGSLPKDRISFDGYAGRTWIQTVSDRKYLAASDGRCLGHLAPSFQIDFSDPQRPAIRITLALHITFTNEVPVPSSRIPGRRKNFTQTWFNHEWLSRTEAVASWLCVGKEQREYFNYKGSSLVLSSKLFSYAVSRGIDESKLKSSEIIFSDEADINVIPFKRNEEGVVDGSASF